MHLRLLITSLVLGASPVSAATIAWVDWTDSTSNSATGVINLGSDSIDVTFTNSVSNNAVQTDGGTFYWTTPSTYESEGELGVENAPSTNDIVQLGSGGTRTITLSETVDNVYFAYVSWNGNSGEFSTEIEILSEGTGYWGTGFGFYEGAKYWFNGEAHGTLLLSGPLDEFSFTSVSEFWHGFTIGVASISGDTPESPDPIPVPAPALLLLSGIAGLIGIRRRTATR